MSNNGLIVRNLRVAAGLSQSEFSKLSGVSKSYISEVETGKNNPSDVILDKFSNTLAQYVDTSYVAGLFDRKSSMSILRVKKQDKKDKYGGGWVLGDGYIARIEFNTIHKVIINILQKVFDCGTYYRTNVGESYRFMAWSDNAEKVLTKLYPYLKVKRRHAEILLELREMQHNNRHLGFVNRGVKPQSVEQYEAAKDLVLNHGYGQDRLARALKMPRSTASIWIRKIKDNFTYRTKEESIKEYQEYQDKAEKLWTEIKRLGNK